VVWSLRPRAPLARAFLVLGVAWAFFMLTAMDLYGPASFFRLHVLCEALVPPAIMQMVLLFPEPHRLARWRFFAYVPAIVMAALYEWWLYDPSGYTRVLYANMIYLATAGLCMLVRLVVAYFRRDSQLARQRVLVVMLGTLAGLSLPAIIVLVSVAAGGAFGMNQGVALSVLFAVSLAYAIVKHDLFELDAMVKRGAYYLVLTGAVSGAYVLALLVVNQILKNRAVTEGPWFPVLFTFAVLLVFDPMRARLQALVDRVFFRTAYNPSAALAAIGQQLASSLTREDIATLACGTIDKTIATDGTRLFVKGEEDGALRAVGTAQAIPPALADRLAQGRLVTAFDPVEVYPEPQLHETVRAGLAALGAEVAVPLLLRDELVGVVTVRAKRSGLFYTAGDAEFLQALAHQAASALGNARSYEALVDLNQRLEQRVRERTAELETANRELVEAYAELKNAEGQLVHTEKMASLGRLVAGVAHEINNPVSFIATNVVPLRRRLSQAAASAPPNLHQALAEADELAEIMARGAERTATIVKDLRSFSRLGEATCKAVDLHEGLEVTLRLLEPRWRDRIVIHRDYGALPPVECDPGQMNQVFMNVLANACDAIAGAGNIWIATRAEGRVVTITVRDDGPGVPPDVEAHIFDPFFTTKDVGAGTGLGLAISHGVVSGHGGRIVLESGPGGGATFRITLPIASAVSVRATG
jgi:signal transduction histidine kinase